MGQADIAVKYLAIGANRHTGTADWSEDGTLAFGADVNVALWRPDDSSAKGITCLLSGHTGVVRAAKFLPQVETDGDAEGQGAPASKTRYLLSGGDDKSLCIWKVTTRGRESTGGGRSASSLEATCLQTIQAHARAINCITTLGRRDDASNTKGASRVVIFATGASDSSAKVWSFDGQEARLLQTICPNPRFFPLCMALGDLSAGKENKGDNANAVILALAGTRDTIQIYVSPCSSPEDVKFEFQATLTGHEGWIRSLDFTYEPAKEPGDHGGDLILASASQDKYIRLWRVHTGTELPAVSASGNDPTLGAFLPGRSPSNKAYRLRAGEAGCWSVTFEALLLGHDDWIYSARWSPNNKTKNAQQARLLSASADNTLSVWEADPSSGIWITTARLGEISREKGATTATGSAGGFWTGHWGPDGKSIVTLGRTGSWRRWVHDAEEDRWVPGVAVGGHTRAVTGIAWAKDGSYLLSTSSDQTTRLHAEWIGLGADSKSTTTTSWHEMARPQIHGYDLNCIDTLPGSEFVSGADEKLMRVFQQPKPVARLLHRLSGHGTSDAAAAAAAIRDLPDAADMPVLGLSNKLVDTSISTSENAYPSTANPTTTNPSSKDPANPITTVATTTTTATTTQQQDPSITLKTTNLDSLAHPPLEDSLSRHTLFPETEKLYGHGYELSCVATSPDGRLIASACRASSLNHAVIRLFETAPKWTEVHPPLAAHGLTVTRLRFSPCGRWLLSVGRDRMWTVFARKEEEEEEGEGKVFGVWAKNAKAHSRMVLDCAWGPRPAIPTAPSAPGATDTAGDEMVVFATAGRDKQVKIWKGRDDDAAHASHAFKEPEVEETEKGKVTCVTAIPASCPVAAIEFLPVRLGPGQGQGGEGNGQEGRLVLAAGLEDGKVVFHTLDAGSLAVVSSQTVQDGLCLPKAVLQLAWRPMTKDGAGREVGYELAVAGEDGSLRIYSYSPPIR